MDRVEVYYQEQTLGRLEEVKANSIAFEYDTSFIQRGLELSPLLLPLRKGTQFGRGAGFRGLPGLFYDSLPDSYGRLVMEKWFSSNGVSSPGVLQMLSYIGDLGIGALRYRPLSFDGSEPELIDSLNLHAQAKSLYKAIPNAKVSKAFLATAGMVGGRQPKHLVSVSPEGDMFIGNTDKMPEGYEHFLIKLDPELEAPVSMLEHCMMQCASACGIRTAKTSVIKNDAGEHLLVKRFDRGIGQRRMHVHSLCGIAEMNYNEEIHSYDDLLHVTQRVTRNHAEVLEAFRRMVFNVLVHNHDDHSKNSSYQMDEQGNFELTPAYDILFTETDLPGHWMLVNGKRGDIRRQDLLAIADRHMIDISKASNIINECIAGTGDFEAICKRNSFRSAYAKKVASFIKLHRKRVE